MFAAAAAADAGEGVHAAVHLPDLQSQIGARRKRSRIDPNGDSIGHVGTVGDAENCGLDLLRFPRRCSPSFGTRSRSRRRRRGGNRIYRSFRRIFKT